LAIYFLGISEEAVPTSYEDLQVEVDADIEERSPKELRLPDRVIGAKISRLLQVSSVNELQSGQ